MKLLAVGLTLLILLIGYVDWKAGSHVSFGFFYLIPVAWAGWRMGRRAGVLFALLGAVASMLADRGNSHEYRSPALIYWNGFNRFAVSAAAAVFTGALRRRVEQQRKLIFDLRRALLTVNETSTLVPLCPICHKFRNDAAFAAEVASFLDRQHDLRSFGRVCDDCLNSRQSLFAAAGAAEPNTAENNLLGSGKPR